jgi:hypothetical protein
MYRLRGTYALVVSNTIIYKAFIDEIIVCSTSVSAAVGCRGICCDIAVDGVVICNRIIEYPLRLVLLGSNIENSACIVPDLFSRMNFPTFAMCARVFASQRV